MINTRANEHSCFGSELERTGFATVADALEVEVFQSLRAESLAQRENAKRVTDDRTICYSGFLADLGDVALEFLTGSAMIAFLEATFGKKYELTRGSSCYTYYEAGDFLDPHKDGAEDCEVTVLVYLEAASSGAPPASSGLKLHIYEDDDGKPGNVIHTIDTHSRSVVAGRGSKVWHGRPRLQPGEHVYLLTACFSAVD